MESHLAISPDRLRAVLLLQAGRTLPAALLTQLMERGGIGFGLNASAIAAAGTASAEDRELELATGEPPQAATPGRIEPPLDEAALPRPIRKGESIGQWTEPVPGRPGRGVDGAELPAPESELPPGTYAGLGHGIRHEPSGALSAARDGELTVTPERVLAVILPGIPDRECTAIDLQHDAHFMEAWIRLEAGEYLTPQDLSVLLASKQVRYGIGKEACADAMVAAPAARTLVLARGQAAVPGEDGRAELLIDDVLRLVEDEFGGVDYTPLNCVKEVEPGTPLVRIHHATKGVAGRNFRGQELAAKAGRDVEAAQFMGEGARANAADPDLIEAAMAGVFKRTRAGGGSVVPLFEVKGDVDMHVGAIETRHAVRISGDIKKGFRVKCEGDLDIGGSIEDARVTTQGNLVVKAGILPGKERVKAHGDIAARHIYGRTVKGRNIRVNGPISGAELLATGEISARSVVASHLTAPALVASDVIGNESEQRTVVHVGVHPFLNSQLERAREGIAEAQAQAASLKDRCKLHSQHVRQASASGRDVGDFANQLRKALAEYEEALNRAAELERVIAEQERAHPSADVLAAAAKVVVKGTVFPGVEIRIGPTARLAVKTALTRVTFALKDGQVVWF